MIFCATVFSGIIIGLLSLVYLIWLANNLEK